jgi:protein TonB
MQDARQPRSGIPATPGAPIQWSAAAARDRLSSTLFLAGLFHGIVLLGVTFSGEPGDPETVPTTSLDVVLITKQYEERAAPEEAELLAQQNLTGAGNSREPMRLQTALGQTLQADALGPEQRGVQQERRSGAEDPTRRPTLMAQILGAGETVPTDPGEPERTTLPRQTAMPGDFSAIELISEPDQQTVVTDIESRELIISANTRESRIAAYLGSWKRKVERVGTLNFPRRSPPRGRPRYPVLEVAIDASGDLREVVVRNSSGEPALDRAAMDILRIAAPFEPFPDFLRTDYDVLRFAYEWQFTDGAMSSRITAVEGS